MKLYFRILGYLAPYRALIIAATFATLGFAAFDAFSIVALIPLLSALFGKGAVQAVDAERSDVEQMMDATLGKLISPDMSAQELLLTINLFILAVFFIKNIFDFLQSYL